MMKEPLFKITNQITQYITKIERFRGFLAASNLSESWLNLMRKKALILEAYHTTHIEGTHLSLEQAKQIFDNKTPPNISNEDQKELLNYKSAFEFVSAYLLDQKPFTQGLIRKIHAILVQNVRGNSAMPGEYRKIQNYVVNSNTQDIIYTPPAAYEIPILMKELIEWINNEKEIHPVIIAGILQFQFVHIHPFLDGNGRTARLLSTLYLYKTGYDFKKLFTISEFYDRNRIEYYETIQSVRNNNLDLTNWIEYFCKGLAFQLNELYLHADSEIKIDLICSEKKLSASQRKALELATIGVFTLKDLVENCPSVSKRTLQRDLAYLQKLELIEAIGKTTQRKYQLKKIII